MTFEVEHAGSIGLYLFILVATIASMAVFFYKYCQKPLIYLAGLLVYGLVALLFAVQLAPEAFEIVNLAAYGIFIGGPIILLIAVYTARRGKLLISAGFYLFLALLVVAVGIDAFLVEPHLLENSYQTIKSDKIKKPIKIAVLSDLQTDHVNSYDQEALKRVLAEKPDLILMPGDYVQCLTDDKQIAEVIRFRDMLRRLGFGAPGGAYAVRGNAEPDGWTVEFEKTGVTANEKTSLYKSLDLDITALSFADSFNTAYKYKHLDDGRFQIIFGHGPDFALAHPQADLLIAGHTHGGQVRLPGIGPILTLSKVPRSWAAGRTEIDPATTLIVSRGVGMERRYAPRLRFLCRPQLVFITLIPAHPASADKIR
ncbi:MAG: metallophosphoesterase [Cyanobacteria bacterium REEB67]|nr:metallophosphoesterase [Cyanobacteria bacterium REEB67]